MGDIGLSYAVARDDAQGFRQGTFGTRATQQQGGGVRHPALGIGPQE